MRGSQQRNALIAEAKTRQRAFGQKLGRLRRHGVDTSSLDQRRDTSEFGNMSSRQLRRYIGQLNSFTSRSTQFVAAKGGAPVDKSLAGHYRKLIEANNARSQAFNDAIRNIRIPTVNLTIAQRNAGLKPGPRAGGDYQVMGTLHENLGGITGQKSLEKIVAKLEKRMDPKYMEREARAQRRIIRKMLTESGDKDVYKEVRALTDQQLIALVDNTDFINSIGKRYATAKSTSSSKPKAKSELYEDSLDKIHTLIDWARDEIPQQVIADEADRSGKLGHNLADRFKLPGIKLGTFTPSLPAMGNLPSLDKWTGKRRK